MTKEKQSYESPRVDFIPLTLGATICSTFTVENEDYGDFDNIW